MRTLAILFANLGLAGLVFGTPLTFQTGDLYWASAQNTAIYAVTGGDLRNATPFAMLGGYSSSQIVFSPDLTVMYISLGQQNKVVAITPSGQVSDYATGITSPTGLIMTSDGRLLVAAMYPGKIYDITGGGNFSSATPFATGLNNPQSFVETSTGIYVTENGRDRVTRIDGGGNLSGATPFATLPSPVDLQVFNGRLYATNVAGQVMDITNGGSNFPVFASGKYFVGLASNGTKLYAVTASAFDWDGSSVYDITAGGDFSRKSSFARMIGNSDSPALDFVPAARQIAQAPQATPEPGTFIAAGCALAGGARWLRRRSAQKEA